jgi:hypothetical protein
MIRSMREALPTPDLQSARSGRAARALVASALVTLVTLAVNPVDVANATPALEIRKPQSGILINHTPEFSGITSDEFTPPDPFNPVELKIYRGTTAGLEPAMRIVPTQQESFSQQWSAVPTPGLEDGTYTAQAEQSEVVGEPGKSNPVTFTVDTVTPHVTIASPASGSSASGETQLLTGSAGTAQYDLHTVRVELYAGTTATPSALAAPPLEVPISGGSWSAVFGALRPGIYTAEAIQGDEAGNVGSSIVTFALAAPPPIRPPAASFSWFPAVPVVGQSVVLVSSSTDAANPITGYAWDLAGTGPFKAAGPVLTTSFASPGNHVVRLQVTDAGSVSSVATETIPVSAPPLLTMAPFPIVRIAGVQTASGVRLSLVSVQAPVGARVTVTCRGRGCRIKPQSRVARATKRSHHASSAVLAFGGF